MNLPLFLSLLLAIPAATELPIPDSSAEEEGVFVDSVKLQYAQVRIEKRVIIRVPRSRSSMPSGLNAFSTDNSFVTYKEKKIGKCIPMDNILGVQRFDDRHLDLVTKSRQQIRVRLEKKCQGRSFYSGFYMERSKDGRICEGRDILHSRTGVKCEIDRFRLLVPE